MLYFKLLCMRYSLKKILIGFGAVLLSFSAIGCQNDDYLQDGGNTIRIITVRYWIIWNSIPTSIISRIWSK